MANDVSFGILLLLDLALVLLVFYAIETLNRRLDRYRLKYGFDKDIESKDIDNKDPEKLQRRIDNREKRFKKRVFKD